MKKKIFGNLYHVVKLLLVVIYEVLEYRNHWISLLLFQLIEKSDKTELYRCYLMLLRLLHQVLL